MAHVDIAFIWCECIKIIVVFSMSERYVRVNGILSTECRTCYFIEIYVVHVICL